MALIRGQRCRMTTKIRIAEIAARTIQFWIVLVHGLAVTDSRAVAIAFGKRHSHVMRTINSMRDSAHPEISAHHRSNFGLVFYESEGAKGAVRQMPMYRITADGLSELAMSFSGDKAAWSSS